MVRSFGRIAAALASLGLAAVATAPAGAQATSRPAAVPGTATATATAYNFAVGLNGGIGGGGSRLGLTRALASSDARDDTAVAKGIALDIGLLANFNRVPTPECPNIEPLFDPVTLPQLIQVESGDPSAASARPVEVRFPGVTAPGPVAGVQSATAGPATNGTAWADTTSGDGPFLSSVGLRSETTSSVDPSGKRSATATVTATTIEVGGVFTIGKPRFTARSAGDGTSAATFTYDWVYFLGQYHTGAAAERAMQDGKAFLEGLFAGLGLKVDLPVGAITTKQNPSSDTTFLENVELSPLRVRLSNIPIARDLIGPILQIFGPDIDRFLDTYLVDDPCADPGLSNIITIARGLLSGDGELGTSMGAVSATTSDRWVAPAPTTTVPESTTTTVPVSVPVEVRDVEVDRSVPAYTPTGPTGSVVDVPAATEPPVDAAPPDDVAEIAAGTTRSTAPVASASKVVSSRGGRLVWATGALLVLVGCLAVADRTVLARRRVA